MKYMRVIDSSLKNLTKVLFVYFLSTIANVLCMDQNKSKGPLNYENKYGNPVILCVLLNFMGAAIIEKSFV